MYNLGTPAQEFKILVAYSTMELEQQINSHLSEDWRMHGDFKIEQNINGIVGGSSGMSSTQSGTWNNTTFTYTTPQSTPGNINTMFRYMQAMVR